MKPKQFKQEFRPNIHKHIEEIFPGSWQTVKNGLRQWQIERGLIGKIGVGFFLSKMTPFFALELDDHETGKAWYGDRKASQYLMRKYEKIRKSLPEPSLTVQSNRGLHLYWILEQWMKANTLVGLAAPEHDASVDSIKRSAAVRVVSG